MKTVPFVRKSAEEEPLRYPLAYLNGVIRTSGYLVSQLWLMSGI